MNISLKTFKINPVRCNMNSTPPRIAKPSSVSTHKIQSSQETEAVFLLGKNIPFFKVNPSILFDLDPIYPPPIRPSQNLQYGFHQHYNKSQHKTFF
jgi:hypothetical protein